ncbi:MAG: hypothetical protein ACI9C1_000855 [Candidatus Aldehydirespiratoraceae bacterium]|jgi:uncharacterized protein YidB (DUF937 family)
MNKKFFATAAAASTLGGALAGATLLAPGLAGAQEDDTNAPETVEETVSPEEGHGGHRGHRGNGEIAELLGLEKSDLREAITGGQTLAEVAADQGIDVQTLIDSMVTNTEERVATALEAGRIDQDKADEILAGAADKATSIVNGEFERPERPEGERGPRGPGGDGEIAELLGLDQADLREAITGGQSLADIAADQGVDTQDLIDAIVDNAEERVNGGLESGRIDQEKADEILAGAADRAESIVNGDFEGRPGHRGGPHPGADVEADA